MIRFINKNDRREVILTYEELAKEFLNSTANKKRKGLLVEMMLFLESFGNNNGLKFVRLKHADWAQLLQASYRLGKTF